MSRWKLLTLAVFIGFAVPTAYSLLYTFLTRRPFRLADDVDTVNVLIVAAPYVVLSLFGVRSRLPWGVALALTLSVWMWWLNSTVSYAWYPDGSGVDFFAIALIFASPIFISVAALVTDTFVLWRSGRL